MSYEASRLVRCRPCAQGPVGLKHPGLNARLVVDCPRCPSGQLEYAGVGQKSYRKCTNYPRCSYTKKLERGYHQTNYQRVVNIDPAVAAAAAARILSNLGGEDLEEE